MDKTKTIFFKGENSPLSNLYHFAIWVGGVLFNSTEQYYQAEKARHFDDKEREEKIMRSATSRQAMREGRQLPKEDAQWNEKKIAVMLKGLTMKFNQCPRYREEVLEWENFVEDTTNDFWGRGRQDTGTNALGSMHRFVREDAERWLIAGDSHTRLMDDIMRKTYLTPHKSDIITRPGGTIEELTRELQHTNLSCYTNILICTGSNNIYTKQGKTHTRVSQILKLLEDLHTYIAQSTTAKLTFIAPLPKAQNTRMTWHKETLRSHNRVVRYIHKKLGLKFVSTRDYMIKDMGNKVYFERDGVHLNMEGKSRLLKKCF